MADLIIMPSLALIAAQYTFLLFDLNSLANNDWCQPRPRHRVHHGDDVDLRRRHRAERTDPAHPPAAPSWPCSCSSASSRWCKVYAGSIHGSVEPSLSWVTPTDFGGASALTEGLLAAVFIYWGWDTATSVNEECEDANTTPAWPACSPRSSSCSIFVIVAFAAQAREGRRTSSPTTPTMSCRATGKLVFGSRRVRHRRAQAPDHRRAHARRPRAARRRSCPRPAPRCRWRCTGRSRPSSPRSTAVHLTPAFSTLALRHPVVPVVRVARRPQPARATATCSSWSVDGVGLMIAYYYGQTGFACVIYYRRYIFTSVKNFFLVGLLPLIGGLTLALHLPVVDQGHDRPRLRGPAHRAGSA